jgi:hypothetical protein
VPIKPRRHRVRVAQDLNGAEATDWHAHFATQPERRRGQRAQRLTFLEPARLAGEVALLDQVLHEPRIGGAVAKVAATTHPQRLVDGAFELAMLLFHVAVLVRHAEVVGRGLQTVMQHQQLVAPLGLGTPVCTERVDSRAEMIRAVLARCTAYLPQAGLEPFDERLKAF